MDLFLWKNKKFSTLIDLFLWKNKKNFNSYLSEEKIIKFQLLWIYFCRKTKKFFNRKFFLWENKNKILKYKFFLWENKNKIFQPKVYLFSLLTKKQYLLDCKKKKIRNTSFSYGKQSENFPTLSFQVFTFPKKTISSRLRKKLNKLFFETKFRLLLCKGKLLFGKGSFSSTFSRNFSIWSILRRLINLRCWKSSNLHLLFFPNNLCFFFVFYFGFCF